MDVGTCGLPMGFADSYVARLFSGQSGETPDFDYSSQYEGYTNGTLSDSESGSNAPSTPPTPPSPLPPQYWGKEWSKDWSKDWSKEWSGGDYHCLPSFPWKTEPSERADVTPPHSPSFSDLGYSPRELQVDQITSASESDPCQVVKQDGHTFAIINGIRYPFDPEVQDPVPGDYHPKPVRKTQRAERLWEFLLRLLKDNKSNPSLIQWVDQKAGTFRLTNSKTIAQMWGRRKSNENMTYEKLSRAMRYYYARHILRPVLGKKLVYSFGPKAKGWRPHETV